MASNHLSRLAIVFTRMTVSQSFNSKLFLPVISSQTARSYAARAGKREKMKAEKKKRKMEKKEEKEKPFVPYHLRVAKEKVVTGPRRYVADKHWLLSSPVDDVWCKIHYPRPFYDTVEAIEMHRETHHPTMMNVMDDLLHMRVELDLYLGKKNKYLSNFTDTVKYPHYFDRGSLNRVIAFCNEADATKAINAGAIMSGGKQLVQQFLDGQITPRDYDHIVAHPDILPELLPIRGIIKSKNFPTQQKGTVSLDLETVVEQYVKGYTFKSEADDYELDYGWIEAPVGRLDMTNEQIEENISALLTLISTYTPTGCQGTFVTQVLLSTTLSKEKFVLKHWKHLEGYAEITRPPITEWLRQKATQDTSADQKMEANV